MTSDPIGRYDFSYSNIFIMIGRMLLLLGVVLSILLFDRGDILSPHALLSSSMSPTVATAATINKKE